VNGGRIRACLSAEMPTSLIDKTIISHIQIQKKKKKKATATSAGNQLTS